MAIQSQQQDNIIWLTDNVDSLEGFKNFYYRFNQLILEKKVPWILLNISCSGSSDSDYSQAILRMLMNSKKPIKTQVMVEAQSFGVLYACIGEERKAWPDAKFMHHSYQLDVEQTSLEELEKIVKETKKMEKETLTFMMKQMGEREFKTFISDFKRGNSEDMEFDAKKAVEYNIVHQIGFIEPLFY